MMAWTEQLSLESHPASHKRTASSTPKTALKLGTSLSARPSAPRASNRTGKVRDGGSLLPLSVRRIVSQSEEVVASDHRAKEQVQS